MKEKNKRTIITPFTPGIGKIIEINKSIQLGYPVLRALEACHIDFHEQYIETDLHLFEK